MRKFYKLSLLIVAIFMVSVSYAQNKFFDEISIAEISAKGLKKSIIPSKFSVYKSEISSLSDYLFTLPKEKSIGTNRISAPILSLPMPDGTLGNFHIWESSVMAPELSAKYPELRQFLGQGIDDPYATIRLDINPNTGIHAQILSSKTGRIFIDPYENGNTEYYMSYFARNATSPSQFICETDANPGVNNPNPLAYRTDAACLGTTLRTYRLALACTGEYAVAVNGPSPTISGVLAAMVTAVNRVTGVYENEVSIRLVLVPSTDLLIYLDGTTDPYTNSSGSAMLGENQSNVTSIIGSTNYDIGHVFSTGGGGIAGLGVTCNSGNKARGVTGLPNPTGDAFYIDFVAHEMGHQFGGSHTFNSESGNCGGNRNPNTAYEVGSGTTIMAYAGICSSDNIQAHSDPYFHGISFDEISNRANGSGSCAVQSATGNTLPVIAPLQNNGLTIPVNTPFTLSGIATDIDGDALTYSWEEMDLGTAGAWNNGANDATAPLFKARVPKITGDRTFPDIAVILAGFPPNPSATLGGLKGETLPAIARVMNFRLNVRDNRAGGGATVSSGKLGCQNNTVFTINSAGTDPFIVTIPNGGQSYVGGSTQTITWNVAGTNAAPFNTTNVKISLSTDGGLTYPTVILASTPNDGSESVAIPAIVTTTARIKVEAVGNIFFDISNANFIITAPANGFTFGIPASITISCGSSTLATTTLTTAVTGTFVTPIVLTSSSIPAGPVVTFSPNPVLPGTSTLVTVANAATLAFGSYVITATGTAGAVIQNATINLTVSPGAGPVFTLQPANQTVCSPGPVTFTSLATGAVSYQWQVSTLALPAFTNIPGETLANFTLAATSSALSGNQYRVIAIGQCGFTNSNTATLTVNSSPLITNQPASQSVCTGTNATFTVAAIGTALTYQWQVSTSAVPAFTNIPGAIGATYTITGATVAQNGSKYRVVISGNCSPPVTSDAATLTVGDVAVITMQPQPLILCSPTNATFSITATGSSNTYQWQLSTDGGATFTDIPGATLANYSFATSSAINGNIYRVKVSGCTTTGITSNNALLTVNTPISISTSPTDKTVCQGSSTTFSVIAAGTGISYQWQYSTTGCGGTFIPITGATSSTYTITSPAPINNGGYRVVVSGTCGAVNSACATLLVNTPIVITTQPQIQTFCIPNVNSATFNVTVTGTAPTYQWQVSTNGGTSYTSIAGANTSTYIVTPLAASQNNNLYRVVVSGACSTAGVVSNAALLIINTQVTITAQPQSVKSCIGQTATFTVGATGSTISYQWQESLNGGAFANLVNNNNYAGVNTAILTISNLTTTLTGNQYRVLVSGVPCGSVTSAPASLTVNLNPAVVLAATSFTSITPYIRTSLVATPNPAGTYFYKFYRNGVLLPTNTEQTLPITVDDFGEYYVTVTNESTGCSATSNKVTIKDSASNTLFVYPNPSNGNFHVRFYNATGTNIDRTVMVYDSKSARVFSQKFTVVGAYGDMNVKLNRITGSGTYFIDVRDNGGKRVAESKIVIQQ